MNSAASRRPMFLLVFFFISIGGFSSDIFFHSSLEEKEVSPAGEKNTAAESKQDSIGENPKTIQVRKEGDFPEVIQAGQRVAVFMDGLEAKDIVISCKAVLERLEGSRDIPTAEVLFNERGIFRKAFIDSTAEFTAFVPSSYIAKGSNAIQIRSGEKSILKFKQFRVSYLPNAESSKPPAEESEKRLANLSRNIKILSGDGEFRNKLVLLADHEMLEAVRAGATAESFRRFLSKDMFDPVSGEPLPVYFSAVKMMNFFKNASGILPCNITPVNSEAFVSPFTDWTYILCGEDTAVLAVSSRDPVGKNMRILLPVPWSGETEVESFRGVIPEKLKDRYPDLPELKVEREKTDITAGYYEKDISFKENLILKLIKSGKGTTEAIDFTYKRTIPPVFTKGIVGKTDKRANPGDIVVSLRKTDDIYSVNDTRTCSIKTADATKGEIDGIKGIIPHDKKSVLIGISYLDGKPPPSDGASMCFGTVPNVYREFSFWVYPRMEGTPPSADKLPAKQASPLKKITLQFYVENNKGYHFLATDLTPDEWQRVILPSDKVKLLQFGRICIVGDPKLPEYAKGNKVSFEFNGFCTIGDEHPEKGKSGLKNARIVGAQKEKTFILSGEPGKYFEYRYQFKEPVEISKVSELSGYEELKYVYKKDAQILEISGKFPNIEKPDKAQNFILSDDARKLLIPEELKKFESGDFAILVIKIML